MLEQLTTGFIIAGGLAGIALGLYGLAPAFFRGRLERLRLGRLAAGGSWDGDEDAYDICDEADEGAEYSAAIDALQRDRGTFGLPGAWQHATPGAGRTDATHHERAVLTPAPFLAVVEAEAAYPGSEDEEHDAALEPAPPVAMPPAPQLNAILRGPEPEDDEEVLDIFREVLPARRTAQGRARAAATQGLNLRDVSIRDLLAEARWTLRTLPRAREVPQR